MRNIVCCVVGAGMLVYACGTKSNSENSYRSGYGSGSGGGAGWEYTEEAVCQEEYDEGVEIISDSYVAPEIVDESENLRERSYEENNTIVKSSKNTDKSTSTKKKIIKDGDITVKTDDVAIAKQGIDSLVKGLNAYYEREDLRKGPARIIYDLIIRVPADNFEKLLSSIEQGKDEVKSKSIRVRDVTEEYMDLTARLSSKRDYLKQYTVLLSKATKVTDILEIQEKIRKLQEEIESAEGRLRYLSDQVTFSTLNVSIEKEVEYVYKPAQKDRFTERVKSGLSTGWDIVVNLVVFLINSWSVIILLILVFFFVRRRIKKRKAKKNS